MMNHMDVANEILKQLGGGRFVAMTGANGFSAGREGSGVLAFRLPAKAGFVKDGINYVQVTLTSADDYSVRFLRVRGLKVTVVAEREGVYNDNLRAVFTAVTGLETSLGTMGRV
jgi:hypothetical protein